MNNNGQSLLELIVVIAVGIVVVSALVFSTIASIRNSQLSKNQAQATRLSQEGLEKIRVSRDRNEAVLPLVTYGTFSSIWSASLTCPSNCYFKFNSSGQLQAASASDLEVFTGDLAQFKRQILIEENTPPLPDEKRFTAIVVWTDFAGQHESKQITLLRKL